MTTPNAVASPAHQPGAASGDARLYRHPRLQLAALLAAPLGWLVIAYLGSLVLFLITSFWHVDAFSGNVDHDPDPRQLPRDPQRPDGVYRIDHRPDRRDGASLVTLTDIVLAFPIAFYMARVASPRTRGLLVVSILLPLWSGYLVKVYAWRLILSGERRPQLGPRAARPAGSRATASRPSGSSRATCGCRT